MTDYALAPYIYYAGGYHAIASSRVAAAGVTYTRGVTDELDLQTGSLTFRCLDDDDTYRPTNPESALYGILGPYLPFLYKLDGANRFAGELAKLEPGQTDDHQTVAKVTSKGLRWVDFQASGPLGTVGRWRDPIASPIFTQVQALTTRRAYWPGEDGTDSTLMSSATPGVAPARVAGVTFEGADGPSGSNKLLTIGSGGRIDGTFPAGISTSGWQIQWVTNAAGADATERPIFQWTTSNGYSWVWSASTATYKIEVFDAGGASIYSSSIGNGGVAPGDSIVFRLKCSLSGSTWTVEPGWYEEDAPVLTGSSGTFTGSAGRPVNWTVKENTVNNGAYFGHLFVTTGVSESLQSYEMLNAINGYPGETTCDRLVRVLAGRSIPVEILGDTSKATKMGAQRPGTVKAQLQEIQRTELGLLFESPDGRGLRLALRNYLIDQANDPALDLTWPTDIGPGFTELSTTQELYNVVIAQDRSGISVTYEETDGRYGTADPPAGSGVVDKTIAVNLFNPYDVAQVASSYLAYFQQVARFGQIVIDLDANPGLRTAAEAVDVGMFIRLTGRTPEPQIMMVVRVGGKDQLKRHLITFDVVPGAVFATGEWGGAGRWDLSTCTVDTGISSTANAIILTMTDDEDWSTTAEPYDLLIAGERVTVTNMNARTGTGPWFQSANITRSVNGVVKAQLAGTEVHIADGGTWGWD